LLKVGCEIQFDATDAGVTGFAQNNATEVCLAIFDFSFTRRSQSSVSF